MVVCVYYVYNAEEYHSNKISISLYLPPGQPSTAMVKMQNQKGCIVQYLAFISNNVEQ